MSRCFLEGAFTWSLHLMKNRQSRGAAFLNRVHVEPHTVGGERCRLVNPYHKSNSCNIMCNIWNYTQRHRYCKSDACNVTYETVQTCTQCHMAWWQKKCVNNIMGNDPGEVSNVQKTKPNSNEQVWKAEKLCWHDNLPLQTQPDWCPQWATTNLLKHSATCSLFGG